MARVAEHFKKTYKTIDIDGVRVIFPEGWGLLRASNTQPVLVMRFEAANENLLKQYQSEVEQVLEASRTAGDTRFMNRIVTYLIPVAFLITDASLSAQPQSPIVLHAARLLNIETGNVTSPGEILVQGDRIAAVGSSVTHPAGAQIIDLGDTTLLPGLIDAHVHLFLHPGAEDLQTVQESVPQRTIIATLAARDDLMAGFTAERDMGTEGAGAADTAVRNAIDHGLIPGPRLRISGNAIDILGGHEDAIGYNPEQRVLVERHLCQQRQ